MRSSAVPPSPDSPEPPPTPAAEKPAADVPKADVPKAGGPKDGDPKVDEGGSESLVKLLGGRRAGIDATVPPLAFVVVWLLTGQSVVWAGAVAIVAGVLLAAYRLWRGDRPRAVLLGLLGVTVAALIALRTGNAADFFLVQLATNAASALAWAVSIVLRWPFLGLVVGTLLGQRTRWRRDPELLRAYSWASAVWIFQYVIRVVVFGALWWANAVVPLAIARVALTWPLVALCVVVSAWVLRRRLPAGHPGLRHPRTPDKPAEQATRGGD